MENSQNCQKSYNFHFWDKIGLKTGLISIESQPKKVVVVVVVVVIVVVFVVDPKT